MIKIIEYNIKENIFGVKSKINQNPQHPRDFNQVYNSGCGQFMYFNDSMTSEHQAYIILQSKMIYMLDYDKNIIENKIRNISKAVCINAVQVKR